MKLRQFNQFLLLHGDEWLEDSEFKDESLEGGILTENLEYLLLLISEFKTSLSKDEDKERVQEIYNSLDSFSKLLSQIEDKKKEVGNPGDWMAETIKAAIQDEDRAKDNRILHLSVGESLLLPGVCNNGHVIIYEIKREAKEEYSFSVYNTGAGTEYHKNIVTSKKKKVFPRFKIKKIPAKNILNPEIYRSIFNLLSGNTGSEDTVKFTYEGILPLLGGEVDVKASQSEEISDYITPQRSETSRIKAINAYIRCVLQDKGDLALYKKFKFFEKFHTFEEFYGSLSADDLYDLNKRKHLERALKKLSRSATKLKLLDRISEQDMQKFYEFKNLVLDKLNKPRQDKVSSFKIKTYEPFTSLKNECQGGIESLRYEDIDDGPYEDIDDGIVEKSSFESMIEVEDLTHENIDAWMKECIKASCEFKKQSCRGATLFWIEKLGMLPVFNDEFWDKIEVSKLEKVREGIYKLIKLNTKNICYYGSADLRVSVLINIINAYLVFFKLIKRDSKLKDILEGLEPYNDKICHLLLLIGSRASTLNSAEYDKLVKIQKYIFDSGRYREGEYKTVINFDVDELLESAFWVDKKCLWSKKYQMGLVTLLERYIKSNEHDKKERVAQEVAEFSTNSNTQLLEKAVLMCNNELISPWLQQLRDLIYIILNFDEDEFYSHSEPTKPYLSVKYVEKGPGDKIKSFFGEEYLAAHPPFKNRVIGVGLHRNGRCWIKQNNYRSPLISRAAEHGKLNLSKEPLLIRNTYEDLHENEMMVRDCKMNEREYKESFYQLRSILLMRNHDHLQLYEFLDFYCNNLSLLDEKEHQNLSKKLMFEIRLINEPKSNYTTYSFIDAVTENPILIKKLKEFLILLDTRSGNKLNVLIYLFELQEKVKALDKYIQNMPETYKNEYASLLRMNFYKRLMKKFYDTSTSKDDKFIIADTILKVYEEDRALTHEEIEDLIMCYFYLSKGHNKWEDYPAIYVHRSEILEYLKDEDRARKIVNNILQIFGESIAPVEIEKQGLIVKSKKGDYTIDILGGVVYKGKRSLKVENRSIYEYKRYKRFFKNERIDLECVIYHSVDVSEVYYENKDLNIRIKADEDSMDIEKEIPKGGEWYIAVFFDEIERFLKLPEFFNINKDDFTFWVSTGSDKHVLILDKNDCPCFKINKEGHVTKVDTDESLILENIYQSTEGYLNKLYKFEDKKHILVWRDKETTREICLPRYGLVFRVKDGTAYIKAEGNLEGWYLSKNQMIIGLANNSRYLVLENDKKEKKVIIPNLTYNRNNSKNKDLPSIVENIDKYFILNCKTDEPNISYRIVCTTVEQSLQVALIYLAARNYRECLYHLRRAWKSEPYTENELNMFKSICNKYYEDSVCEYTAIMCNASYMMLNSIISAPESGIKDNTLQIINANRKHITEYINHFQNIPDDFRLNKNDELKLVEYYYKNDIYNLKNTKINELEYNIDENIDLIDDLRQMWIIELMLGMNIIDKENKSCEWIPHSPKGVFVAMAISGAISLLFFYPVVIGIILSAVVVNKLIKTIKYLRNKRKIIQRNNKIRKNIETLKLIPDSICLESELEMEKYRDMLKSTNLNVPSILHNRLKSMKFNKEILEMEASNSIVPILRNKILFTPEEIIFMKLYNSECEFAYKIETKEYNFYLFRISKKVKIVDIPEDFGRLYKEALESRKSKEAKREFLVKLNNYQSNGTCHLNKYKVALLVTVALSSKKFKEKITSKELKKVLDEFKRNNKKLVRRIDALTTIVPKEFSNFRRIELTRPQEDFKPAPKMIPLKIDPLEEHLNPLKKLFERFFEKESEKNKMQETNFVVHDYEALLPIGKKMCENLQKGIKKVKRQKEFKYTLKDLDNLEKELKEKLDLDKELEKESINRLLKFANKDGKSPANIAESIRRTGLELDITIDDIKMFLVQKDKNILRSKNKSLTDEDIEKIYKDAIELLILKTRITQLNNALELTQTIKNIEKNKIQEKDRLIQNLGQILEESRHFNPYEEPEYLVFEEEAQMLLRKKNLEILKRFLKYDREISKALQEGKSIDQILKEKDIFVKQNKNLIKQLIMGGGKTKAILPLLGLTLANGTNIVTLIVPRSLYETNFIDLGNILSRFREKVYTLSFERHQEYTTDALKGVYEKILEVKNNRGCLIIIPESIQSMMLKYIELLYALKNPSIEGLNEYENELKEQAKVYQKIFKELKQSGTAVIDEVDTVLNCRNEVNYTIGESLPYEKVRWEFAYEIYEILHNKIGFDLTVGGCSLEYYKDNLEKRLIEELAEHFINKLGLPHEYSNSLKDYISNRKNLDFEKLKSNAKVDKNKILRIFDEIILAKEYVSHVLPFTLTKKCFVNYGKSKKEEYDFAVPYIGNMKPSETSEFGHPDVLIAFTIQNYLLKGLSKLQVKKLILGLKQLQEENIRNNQKDQVVDDYQRIFEEMIEDKSQIGKVFLNDIEIDDDKLMDKLTELISKNKFACKLYLNNIAFPKLPNHTLRISSNFLDIGNNLLFNRKLGFTGTPNNSVTYPEDFNVGFCHEEDGFVLGTLINGNADMLKMDFSEIEDIEKFVSRVNGNYNAIIDTGAVFKGVKNKDVARMLLEVLPEEKIDGVTYFDDFSNKLTILYRNGKTEDLNSSKILPKRRFTYYDQYHTTGTDVKQDIFAKAYLTIGNNTSSRDIFQSAMRMRGLGKGQKVTFIVPNNLGINTVKDLINRSVKNESKQLTKDLIFSIKQKIKHIKREEQWESILNMDINQVTKEDFDSLIDTLNTSLWDTARFVDGEVDSESFIKQLLADIKDPKIKQIFKNKLKEYLPAKIISNKSKIELDMQVEQEQEQEQEKELETQIEKSTLKGKPAKRVYFDYNLDIASKGFLGLFKVSGMIKWLTKNPSFINITKVYKEVGFDDNIFVTENFIKSIKNYTAPVINPYMKRVQYYLEIWEKGRQRPLVLLLSPEDAGQVYYKILRSKGSKNIKVALKDHDGTLVKETNCTNEIVTHDLEDTCANRVLAQIKFMEGCESYSLDKYKKVKEQLKDWLKEASSEKELAKRIKFFSLIRQNTHMQAKLVKSDIDKLFAEVKSDFASRKNAKSKKEKLNVKFKKAHINQFKNARKSDDKDDRKPRKKVEKRKTQIKKGRKTDNKSDRESRKKVEKREAQMTR